MVAAGALGYEGGQYVAKNSDALVNYVLAQRDIAEQYYEGLIEAGVPIETVKLKLFDGSVIYARGELGADNKFYIYDSFFYDEDGQKRYLDPTQTAYDIKKGQRFNVPSGYGDAVFSESGTGPDKGGKEEEKFGAGGDNAKRFPEVGAIEDDDPRPPKDPNEPKPPVVFLPPSSSGDSSKETESAGNHFQQNRHYWSKEPIEFRGNKVYQRDDLFDPNQTSTWRQGGRDATGTNLERMAAGRAPLDASGNPINLHHMSQTQSGTIAEMTQSFHSQNHGTIHINPNTIPSGINRSQFDTWRVQYWRNRAATFGD